MTKDNKKPEKYSLTSEHKAMLPAWAQKWIDNSFQSRETHLTDEEAVKIKESVESLYIHAKKTPPPRNRIVIVPSPFVARFATGAASWIWYCRDNNLPAPQVLDELPAPSDCNLDVVTRTATLDAIMDAISEQEMSETTPLISHKITEVPHLPEGVLQETLGISGASARACYEMAGEGGLKCAQKSCKMYEGGNMWSGWDCFLSFFKEVVKLPIEYEQYEGWLHLARTTGFRFVHEKFCIVSELPVEFYVNEVNQGHKDGGPYVRWRDGTGIYMLNGTRVPRYLAETPGEQLSLDWFHKQTNADIRTQFVLKYGVDRLLESGKLVDSYEKYPDNEMYQRSQYELWDMASLVSTLDYAPYLKMTNQTTGIFHVEAVGPECQTVDDAIKFRCGGRDVDILNIT